MIVSEIVERAGDAAFASRPQCGFVAWNDAAEDLLGFRARDVLGKPCHQVLAGRDIFGNFFCSENCPLVRMAQKRQAVERFEILYCHKSGRVIPIGVTVVVVPNDEPSKVDLIHLLELRGSEPDAKERGPSWPTGHHHPGPDRRRPQGARDAGSACLTPRELEVLRLMAEGFGTRAVAGQLNISPVTARNHIQNILTRLEVHSRLEAVSVARRCGIL